MSRKDVGNVYNRFHLSAPGRKMAKCLLLFFLLLASFLNLQLLDQLFSSLLMHREEKLSPRDFQTHAPRHETFKHQEKTFNTWRRVEKPILTNREGHGNWFTFCQRKTEVGSLPEIKALGSLENSGPQCAVPSPPRCFTNFTFALA